MDCLFFLDNSKRLSGKWQCLTSTEKLEYQQFCDGKFDCPDLSDEFMCSSERRHHENRLQKIFANLKIRKLLKTDSAVEFSKRMCIPYIKNDWRVASCKICNSAEFVCDPLHVADAGSKCVQSFQVCNGKKDCPNAEDERFCKKGEIHSVLLNRKRTVITPSSNR